MLSPSDQILDDLIQELVYSNDVLEIKTIELLRKLKESLITSSNYTETIIESLEELRRSIQSSFSSKESRQQKFIHKVQKIYTTLAIEVEYSDPEEFRKFELLSQSYFNNKTHKCFYRENLKKLKTTNAILKAIINFTFIFIRSDIKSEVPLVEEDTLFISLLDDELFQEYSDIRFRWHPFGEIIRRQLNNLLYSSILNPSVTLETLDHIMEKIFYFVTLSVNDKIDFLIFITKLILQLHKGCFDNDNLLRAACNMKESDFDFINYDYYLFNEYSTTQSAIKQKLITVHREINHIILWIYMGKAQERLFPVNRIYLENTRQYRLDPEEDALNLDNFNIDSLKRHMKARPDIYMLKSLEEKDDAKETDAVKLNLFRKVLLYAKSYTNDSFKFYKELYHLEKLVNKEHMFRKECTEAFRKISREFRLNLTTWNNPASLVSNITWTFFRLFLLFFKDVTTIREHIVANALFINGLHLGLPEIDNQQCLTNLKKVRNTLNPLIQHVGFMQKCVLNKRDVVPKTIDSQSNLGIEDFHVYFTSNIGKYFYKLMYNTLKSLNSRRGKALDKALRSMDVVLSIAVIKRSEALDFVLRCTQLAISVTNSLNIYVSQDLRAQLIDINADLEEHGRLVEHLLESNEHGYFNSLFKLHLTFVKKAVPFYDQEMTPYIDEDLKLSQFSRFDSDEVQAKFFKVKATYEVVDELIEANFSDEKLAFLSNLKPHLSQVLEKEEELDWINSIRELNVALHSLDQLNPLDLVFLVAIINWIIIDKLQTIGLDLPMQNCCYINTIYRATLILKENCLNVYEYQQAVKKMEPDSDQFMIEFINVQSVLFDIDLGCNDCKNLSDFTHEKILDDFRYEPFKSFRSNVFDTTGQLTNNALYLLKPYFNKFMVHGFSVNKLLKWVKKVHSVFLDYRMTRTQASNHIFDITNIFNLFITENKVKVNHKLIHELTKIANALSFTNDDQLLVDRLNELTATSPPLLMPIIELQLAFFSKKYETTKYSKKDHTIDLIDYYLLPLFQKIFTFLTDKYTTDTLY